MRIAAFMIVGPGEGGRWLKKVLHQLWADDIAICLNNADDYTKAVVKSYNCYVVEDNREWGKFQNRIKEDFLKKIAEELKPDWVWCLDADEVFDKRFTREKAEELAASTTDVSYHFWCIQLWNDEAHWRPDLSFPNVRFYKLVPSYGLNFFPQPLHCGLAPWYAYKYASDSGLIFKHYGLMRSEDRARKVARYAKYDPKEQYKAPTWYKALRNEKAPVEPFEENNGFYQMLKEKNVIEIHRKKLGVRMPRQKETIYLFRNKNGKVVEAVGERQRDQFLKTPGFTMLQSLGEAEPRVNAEAPVVHAPESEAPQSPEPTPEPKPEPEPEEPKAEPEPTPEPKNDAGEVAETPRRRSSTSAHKPRAGGRKAKGNK